jgi:hypothetical protein
MKYSMDVYSRLQGVLIIMAEENDHNVSYLGTHYAIVPILDCKSKNKMSEWMNEWIN